MNAGETQETLGDLLKPESLDQYMILPVSGFHSYLTKTATHCSDVECVYTHLYFKLLCIYVLYTCMVYFFLFAFFLKLFKDLVFVNTAVQWNNLFIPYFLFLNGLECLSHSTPSSVCRNTDPRQKCQLTSNPRLPSSAQIKCNKTTA